MPWRRSGSTPLSSGAIFNHGCSSTWPPPCREPSGTGGWRSGSACRAAAALPSNMHHPEPGRAGAAPSAAGRGRCPRLSALQMRRKRCQRAFISACKESARLPQRCSTPRLLRRENLQHDSSSSLVLRRSAALRFKLGLVPAPPERSGRLFNIQTSAGAASSVR